jgi:phage baseplate assembly protein gpV
VEGISIEGLLNQYSKNSTNAMFTSIPGRVVGTPNLAEQRVDVQILVNKVTTDNVSREHTVLLNVPLVFQGSQSSQFSFPVVSGDTVLLVFSQRSIDRFKLGGKEPHTPADFRKYSKNDAMALPGLFSFTDAINNPSKRTLSHSTDDAVVSHNIGTSNECEVRLKASGGIVINAPGNQVTVNCDTSTVNADTSSEVNTQSATINASSATTINSPDTNVTGNLNIQGHLNFVGATGSADVVASDKSLVSHTHTGDSGGSTSPPN